MKRQVAAIWDTKPGTYHTGRTRTEREDLLKAGYTPAGAERYAKALEHAIGPGLRKRIREAVN